MTRSNALTSDRRTLLLGSALVCSMLTVWRGLPALWRHERALEEQVASARIRLDSARATERVLAAVLAAADPRGTAPGTRLRDAAFDGATPTESSATALQYVVAIAGTLGATVHSVTPTTASRFEHGIAPLSLRLSITTDAIGLRAILRTLAAGAKLVVPREITVQQSAPAAAEDTPEALRVEITLASVARERATGASP